MTIFPPTLYQVFANYDGEAANWLDATPSFSLALDHFTAAYNEGREPRVVQIYFDLDDNHPEAVRGVTDEFLAAMKAANAAIAAE